MKNLKLSERFMYYSGLLVAMKGTDVIDDLTHISDLLDAEEQGLLLRLPCKVGDALFVLTSDSPTGIEETKCKNIQVTKKCVRVYALCQYDDWGSGTWCFRNGNFGKNVFLSKAEAEKKLAEMEK